MNYEEFKKQIKDEIKDRLPEKFEDADVSITEVRKNNDTVLDGLLIRTEDSNITPNIYLNPFFESYEKGMDMDDILGKIAAMRVEHDQEKNFPLDIVTDFEKAKDHIVCRLVNAEENQQLLANKPHTNIEDLAVTYHLMLGSDENGSATIAIHDGIMEAYGIDTEQLHEIALKNMDSISPVKFENMNNVVREMMIPDLMNNFGMDREEAEAAVEEMMPPGDGKMFVLTNEAKLHGAAEILKPEVQEMIAEQLGGDFYVLPSSVHETLIIPKSADMSHEELENMVQEVNATQVAPEERLSNHVYEYDAQAKELMRSDRAEERRALRESKQEKSEVKEEKRSLKDRLAEKKAEATEINKSHTKSVEKHKEAALA